MICPYDLLLTKKTTNPLFWWSEFITFSVWLNKNSCFREYTDINLDTKAGAPITTRIIIAGTVVAGFDGSLWE